MENLPAVQKNVSFIPQNIAGALELAGIMARSGLMPKGIQTKEAVFVAMQMGLEIGLSPMAAVQNIAVIHNRPGLFGDVALAVVRGSGELEVFEEWQTGVRKTPEWTFFCKVKRKGSKEAIGSYSWAEACEAGQDKADPASSWKKWTNRMMQFKARNFVLRDHFTDFLKGIRTHEENMDAIDLDEVNGSDGQPQYQLTAEPAAGAEENDASCSVFHMTAAERYQPEELVLLTAFVKETAGHHNVSDYIIEGRAMDNWGGFAAAFEVWAEGKRKPEGAAVETDGPVEVTRENTDQAAPVTAGPPTNSEVWADFRSKYINLKTSGYSVFVLANRGPFENCPQEQLEEAKEKWSKLYPGQVWMTVPVSGGVNGSTAGPKVDTQDSAGFSERSTSGPVVIPETLAETVPLSYTRQYKDLMEFKNEFPTLYSQARITTALAPDSVANCSALFAKMEKLVEEQMQNEMNAGGDAPPAVASTQPAGIDEFNQFG